MTTPQLNRERLYLNLAAALAGAATFWLFLCPDLRRALCGCALGLLLGYLLLWDRACLMHRWLARRADLYPVVCAWCGEELRWQRCARTPDVRPGTSHGMCDRCAAQARQQVRAATKRPIGPLSPLGPLGPIPHEAPPA